MDEALDIAVKAVEVAVHVMATSYDTILECEQNQMESAIDQILEVQRIITGISRSRRIFEDMELNKTPL
jgi:hypothetical protein